MELDTNNHSVFLLYYHLVLVTKRDFPQSVSLERNVLV